MRAYIYSAGRVALDVNMLVALLSSDIGNDVIKESLHEYYHGTLFKV